MVAPVQKLSLALQAVRRVALGSLFICATTVFLYPLQASAQGPIKAEFSRIGDASHFEFEGTGVERYKVEQLSSGEVSLRLPSLDEASLRRLRSLADAQVKQLAINEKAADGMIELSFTVAKGVDFFEYVSDQPARLVLDFFPAENAPVATSVASPVTPAAPVVAKKSSDKQTERGPAGGDFVIVAKQGPNSTTLTAEPLKVEPVPLAEKIASRKDFERGIFDGGDPEFRRFTVKDYEVKESARFAARAALRIPYPMLDLGFPKLQALIEAPPIYEIRPGESEENKKARLILTLFNNKRQALTLSTAKDFLTQYPDTEYDEIIRYIMADTHYALWMKERDYNEEHKIKDVARLHDSDFEEAMGIYNNLVERYPDSPMTSRTLLLVGYSYLERGDSFGALKTFQRFVRLKPDSKFAGQVKVSIARAFLALNRWEDAIQELDSVEKNAKNVRDRQEAAFRKGDVSFRKGDFQKAIDFYDAAIKKYPEATGRFPNAFYNLAEAKFRSGRERDAIDSYRQFLQKFPEHRYGGFAMTRLGEMIETLVGADDRRVTGAFFESFFRYRSTPGADIARLRVLTMRMPTMKDREMKDALREIDEIVKRDADLSSIEEFKTITVADALTARKEYSRATKDLIQYYKENTQSKHLPLIKNRIVRNLVEEIRDATDKGDFIQALRLHSRDQLGWLKGSQRSDLSFLAARAYEQAGVSDEAKKNYTETLERLLEQAAKPELKDVFEASIAIESVRLRLAAIATGEKDYMTAETQLKQIKNFKALSATEQVERTGLAADVAEARGQTEPARKYLAEMLSLYSEKAYGETFSKDPSVIAPLHLRMAKLAAKDKDYKQAEISIDKAMQMAGGNEKAEAAALETKAEIQFARGKRKEAIESYKFVLEKPIANADVSRNGFDSVRYRLGQLQYEMGDLKSAELTWSQLAQDEKSLWRKLAAEQMTSAKWRDEYKRYVNRIPAAAEIR